MLLWKVHVYFFLHHPLAFKAQTANQFIVPETLKKSATEKLYWVHKNSCCNIICMNCYFYELPSYAPNFLFLLQKQRKEAIFAIVASSRYYDFPRRESIKRPWEIGQIWLNQGSCMSRFDGSTLCGCVYMQS